MYEFHWREHVMSRDWLVVRGIAIATVGGLGVAGGVFASMTSEVGAYAIGFATGAMLFCTYAPQLLADEPTHPHAYGNTMAVGASFVVWGPLLAFVACVSYGFVCALVCSAVFWRHSRSWLIRTAPVTSHVGALGIYALMNVRLGGSFSLAGLTTDTALVAVLWNALLFAQMACARHVKLPDERRRLAGLCQACGYDMTGIAEGDPCPECGRRRSS